MASSQAEESYAQPTEEAAASSDVCAKVGELEIDEDEIYRSVISGEDLVAEPLPPGVDAAAILAAALADDGESGTIEFPDDVDIQDVLDDTSVSIDSTSMLNEEHEDTLEVTVTRPTKVGEGMSSYMTYKVTTKTNMAAFRRPEVTVNRKFNDFLTLHAILVNRHLPRGCVVPVAPEKSVLGTAMTKLTKDDGTKLTASLDFVEKRRASLERYLNRIAKHRTLRQDSDFHRFLDTEDVLLKPPQSSALTGANMMRLMKDVGQVIAQMRKKVTESDQWFDEQHQHFNALEHDLRRLHSTTEELVAHRRDFARTTGAFSRSAARLAVTEQHPGLSRALGQLADACNSVEQAHQEQVDRDFFMVSEMVKDYLNLISPVRACFQQRIRSFQAWQSAQVTLQKKRELKVKAQAMGSEEKLKICEGEVVQWEEKMEKCQEDFESISRTIREEIDRFEVERVSEFRSGIIRYVEQLMKHQEQITKFWENYLPEAKKIC